MVVSQNNYKSPVDQALCGATLAEAQTQQMLAQGNCSGLLGKSSYMTKPSLFVVSRISPFEFVKGFRPVVLSFLTSPVKMQQLQ